MTRENRSNKAFQLETDKYPFQGDNNFTNCLAGEIRNTRRRLGLTVAELTEIAGISPSGLSKIENGTISPSLNTLKRLASALDVSVVSFFSKIEEGNSATFVVAGDGQTSFGSGRGASLTNEFLGRKISRGNTIESFITTLDEVSGPIFSGAYSGSMLLYVLDGQLEYYCENVVYTLGPDDSLFLNSGWVHGPEKIIEHPVRILCVIANSQ